MGKARNKRGAKEGFFASEKGKVFFNFAYSLGAAVVIMGALFKIQHWPGGSVMLSIGMGVEVIMFVLSAFERPQKEYKWEEVFPVLESGDSQDRPILHGGGGYIPTQQEGSVVGTANGSAAPIPSSDMQALTQSMQELAAATQGLANLSNEINQLGELITSLTQLAANVPSQEEGVDVSDTEQQVAGINTLYERQSNNVRTQLETLESLTAGLKTMKDMYETSMVHSFKYKEESQKLTQNLAQINSVYERMLSAMTLNNPTPPTQG